MPETAYVRPDPSTTPTGPDSDLAAEVTHALRNHFHRLYHWMEVLGDECQQDASREAWQAADSALRTIESIATQVMSLSRPFSLARMPMSVGDLVTSTAELVGRSDGVTVESRVAGEGTVEIDGGRFSRTIDAVLRRLRSGGAAVAARVSGLVEDDGWCVLTIDVPAAAGATDEIDVLLDWAEGERVIVHHGGRLVFEEVAGERRAVIVLPVV